MPDILLTKKSFLSGETEDWFHNSRIIEPNRLYEAMLSPTVISSLSKELLKQYKKDYGVIFDNGIDQEYLRALVEIYLEHMKEL